MQKSLIGKLNTLVERRSQIDEMLSQPDATKDQTRFKELSKELSEIMPIVECFEKFKTVEKDIQVAEELTTDGDPDLRELGLEELQANKNLLTPLQEKLIINTSEKKLDKNIKKILEFIPKKFLKNLINTYDQIKQKNEALIITQQLND